MNRPLARLGVFVSILVSGCATDKPPTTDSGPAKADAEAGNAEAGNEPWIELEPRAGEAEAGGAEAGPEPAAGACKTDADCVEDACCHAASCVIASAAPDCSDVACTAHCEGGTLDCGQGHCACQDGSCVAVIGGW